MEEIWIETTEEGLEETPRQLRKERSKKMNWLLGIGAVCLLIALLWNVKLPMTAYYESREYGFSLYYPADWHYVEGLVANSAVAFVPPKETKDGENVLIDAVSVVFIDLSRQGPTTLDQFVKMGLETFKKETGGALRILESRPFPIGGLPGHVISFVPHGTARDSMRFVIYTTIRGKQAMTITYLGQKDSFSKNSKKVEGMIKSLKFF